MENGQDLRNHPAVRDVVEALHDDHQREEDQILALEDPDEQRPDGAAQPGRGENRRQPEPAPLGRRPNLDRPDREEQRAMPAFKMPAFDPERAERFFQEADDRFLALGIYHPSLRYTAITPFLPAQLMESVASRHDELAQADDRYEALKRAVLDYSFRPFWARQHAMDSLPSVSASLSPSQLMLRLIALKGTGHPFCEGPQYQFLKRLPAQLFEKFKDKPWDLNDPMKFAHLVERSWAPHMSGPHYAAIPHPGLTSGPTTATSGTLPTSTASGAVPAAVAQVSEERENETDVLDVLRPLVAAIQAGRRGSNNRGSWRGGRGNRGRGGRQSGQPGSGNNFGNNANQQVLGGQGQKQSRNRTGNDEWCYFHQPFGSSATNCRPPCAYNQRTTAMVRTLQPYEYGL